MAEGKSVHSITGRQTTFAAAEETILLSLDGALAAATISVPLGTNVAISDLILGGDLPSLWRLQQTNDGISFFDIALFEVSAALGVATPLYTYNVGLIIAGGATVAFRLRVQTPFGGGIPVVATLRSYSEP